MVPKELCVPQLGEGLREVRIVELRREVGEQIRRGDALYVVETDKSTVELESPFDGRVMQWLVAPDDIVPINAAVVLLAEESTSVTEGERRPSLPRTVPPRTRAYAQRLGITAAGLDAIPSASAKLMPSDIDAHLTRKRDSADVGVGYRDCKISGNQRTLIYRFRRSITSVIPGTLAIEIPWSSLTASMTDGNGTKPTPFQVFAHTVAQIARQYPKFRSTILGDDVVREYAHVNVGMAIARPHDELITAVIRDADCLSIAEFVRACAQQMRGAIRSGDQAADDTQILLTHLGEFGIVDAIPTLVAPASSIFFLGVPAESAATTRVVLTFDHRVINGAAAAHFLEAIKGALQDESIGNVTFGSTSANG
jgi:pyruvate/2-oxoglutarate dehydrogenase complex dihydrolipoamide acyltransferase (E2) component